MSAYSGGSEPRESLSPLPVPPGRLVLALFLAAAALRLAHVPVAQERGLSGDEVEYDALARGLLETGEYSAQPGFSPLLYSPATGAPTSFRAPGWPLVLASIYYICGLTPIAARIFLSFWNAFGCVLVLLIATRLFSSVNVGIASAVLWSIWPGSVFGLGAASTTLATEGLVVPVLLLSLWFLVCFATEGGWSHLLGGAIMLGLSALVRPNLALIVPFTAMWILFFWTRTPKQRVKSAAILVGLSFLVVFPWMMRNYAVLGVFTIATQREPLFLGNNQWARGSYDAEFFNRPDSFQVAWMQERYPDFLNRSEAEKSRLYTAEALGFVTQNPRDMAWLLWRKALLFWSPLREAPGGYWYDFAFASLVPLFAVGVAVLRHNRSALLLLAPVIAVLATSLIVLAMPRYRYPAEACMIVIACGGLHQLAGRVGRGKVLVATLVLVAVNAFVSYIY